MAEKCNAKMVDIVVGKNIRLRRTTLGISQDELGVKVGVTFQQIQKYERATNRVSASRLFEIAETLEVPVQYFFGALVDQAEHVDCAENTITPQEHDKLTTRETFELCRAYHAIKSPKSRKGVFEMVKSLAKGAK